MFSRIALFLSLIVVALSAQADLKTPFKMMVYPPDIPNQDLTIEADFNQFWQDVYHTKTTKAEFEELNTKIISFHQSMISNTSSPKNRSTWHTEFMLATAYFGLGEILEGKKESYYKKQALFWAQKIEEIEEEGEKWEQREKNVGYIQIILAELHYKGIKGVLKPSISTSKAYLDKALAHNYFELNAVIARNVILEEDILPLDFQAAVDLLREAHQNQSPFATDTLSWLHGDTFESSFNKYQHSISKKRLKQISLSFPTNLDIADQYEAEHQLAFEQERTYFSVASNYFPENFYDGGSLIKRKPNRERACFWLKQSIEKKEEASTAGELFEQLHCEYLSKS